jgi:hypothetical protein
MKPWIMRPREEAHLLNPAFCCSVLTSSVIGYSSVEPKGMHFPLIFMILPIILHKPTCEVLPSNTRTSVAAWLQKNPSSKIQYHERTVSLVPFVREALLFGLINGWLTIGDTGRIQTSLTESSMRDILRKSSEEIGDYVMRARFVGKWFASAGSPQTVMALWGIRP